MYIPSPIAATTSKTYTRLFHGMFSSRKKIIRPEKIACAGGSESGCAGSRQPPYRPLRFAHEYRLSFAAAPALRFGGEKLNGYPRVLTKARAQVRYGVAFRMRPSRGYFDRERRPAVGDRACGGTLVPRLKCCNPRSVSILFSNRKSENPRC